MSKRCGQDSGFNTQPAAKKTKINHESKTNTNTNSNNLFCDDDIWGDDFNEDEMVKEVDFIVSQRSCQETISVFNKVESNVNQGLSTNRVKPSTSNYVQTFTSYNSPVNNNYQSDFKNLRSSGSTLTKVKSDSFFTCTKNTYIKSTTNTNQTQILASSGIVQSTLDCDLSNVNYEVFKQNNICKSTQHSYTEKTSKQSFQQDDKTREKLFDENSKLLFDLRLKVGEVEYLRNRLRKAEGQIDKDRRNKEEQLKQQEEKYIAEISALNKEKEELHTKFELKNFEMQNLSDRFKMLEAGSIKLMQPSVSVIDSSTRKKLNSSYIKPAVKSQSFNNSIKDKICDKLKLSLLMNNYPLNNLPKTIYESSLEEKPVINVEIVEKSGRRNLPILQEEDTFRIFENPELVKPLITIIGNEELKVKFYLSDLNNLIMKNEKEINSISSISIINKLVATTRELLLNSTTVLQKISDVMTNDDIRDINDTYFSEIYNTPVFHTKTIFDGSCWYNEERGIEARRSLGVLSHVALQSTYLSKYIGGKTLLITQNDSSYEEYITYMSNYNCWPHKNKDHEFLQLLLKFVTAVRLVRRAHQFTGLLSSVAITLTNAQKIVPFQESGVNLTFEILKEILLSRPLLQTFIPLTQMIEVFGISPSFTKELCKSSGKSSFESLQNIVHYKSDACILEIYVKQLQYFRLDPVTTIKIADALISFTHLTLCNKMIIRESENYMIIELLQYILKLLCDCLNIDTDILKNLAKNDVTDPDLSSRWYNSIPEDWKLLDEEYWDEIKFIQFNVLKKGIRFFNYLMTHESSNFRLQDSEVRLSKLLEKVLTIKGLVLRDNEREAISDLKKDLKQFSAVINKNDINNQERLNMQRLLYKKR